VGDIGANDLGSFTAVGQGVNNASRLEHQCPPGKILLSDSVAPHAENVRPLEAVREIQLKGLQAPLLVRTLNPGA
jgi:class 3 adenylate cyclase